MPEDKDWSAFDDMTDGAQVIDPQYRYVYVNEAAAKHGKKPREEFVGKTMMELYPGIEQAAFFPSLKKCLNSKVLTTAEVPFTYPDGTERWFELRMEPIPEGCLIISLDVTAMKKQQDDVQKKLRSQE